MQTTDSILVIIGKTGTGKSTFIRLLTDGDNIRIGNDLESQTSNVASAVADFNTDDSLHRVTLVDTPGFDNSYNGLNDIDILERIAKFLQARKQVNGLIYLHRISDTRMDFVAKKTLEMFTELCGDANFNIVGIVTTDWNVVGKEGDTRESALEEKYFKHLIDGGAKMYRHNGETESAKLIVSKFVHNRPVTLKIQEELNAGMTLSDTSAGAVIMREMGEMTKEHERQMEYLRERMRQEGEDTRAEIDAERRRLEQQIAQLQEDRNRFQAIHVRSESLSTVWSRIFDIVRDIWGFIWAP